MNFFVGLEYAFCSLCLSGKGAMDEALLVVPIPNGSKKAVQFTLTSQLTVNSRMFVSIEMLIKQKFIIYWASS